MVRNYQRRCGQQSGETSTGTTSPSGASSATEKRGSTLVAGPHPAIDSMEPGEAGFSGSLVIAEFDSLAAARQWAAEDPYMDAGVYNQVTVKPFKKVLP